MFAPAAEGCFTWYCRQRSSTRPGCTMCSSNTRPIERNSSVRLATRGRRPADERGIAPLAVDSLVRNRRSVREAAPLRGASDARRRVKQGCPRLGRGNKSVEGCGRAGGRYKRGTTALRLVRFMWRPPARPRLLSACFPRPSRGQGCSTRLRASVSPSRNAPNS